MENDFKKKLLDHIKCSDLDDDQKELWSLFAKISMPEEDEAVYEAVSGGNENLYLLTRHLRDKIWDMKEKNADAWKRLISDTAGEA